MANRRATEAIAWFVAGILVIAGVITTVMGLLTPVSFGWFAYQPLTDTTFGPVTESVLLSRTAAIGLIFVTLGLLALAFMAGWRLARRPNSPTPSD